MAHKSSITQITLANDRLRKDVSLIMKVPEKEVTKIMKFVGEYIADTIERGQMEAVMLPYFGKFKPKKSSLTKDFQMAARRGGLDMVNRAINNKVVLDLRGNNRRDDVVIVDNDKSKNPRIL